MRTFLRRYALGTNASLFIRRAFIFLWIGQLVSLLGDNFYRVGLTWYVTTKFGERAGALGLGLALSLPPILFGVIVGVIIDRADRLKLLVITDLVRAAIVGGITLLLAYSTSSSLIAVCLGAAVLVTASLLFTPSLQAYLPTLAGGDKQTIVKFDTWLLGTMNTLGVIGPALAGVLLANTSIVFLTGLDALSFVFSAYMLVMMRHEDGRTGEGMPPSSASSTRKKLLPSVKEGLSFILKHPVLRPQFSTFPIVESVVYVIPFILPAFLKEYARVDSRIYGLLLALWALGRVGGMFLVSHTPLRQHRGIVFSLNFFVQGMALCVFTLFPLQGIGIIAFILLGLPAGAAQVCMFSYIQIEVPTEIRGRVFAAMSTLVTWTLPLGLLVLTTLNSWKGTQVTLLSISLTLLLCGTFIALHRVVREVQ
jgi:DHA3 family macrolide efflux protein-like MFS transporter